MTALTQLYTTAAGLVVTGNPKGNDFFDEPRLAGFAGSTMLLLQRTEEASEFPSDSIKRRLIGDAKARVPANLNLASCRLVEGHPNEPSRLMEESLLTDRGGVVAPIITRIKSVQAGMMTVAPTSTAWVGQLLCEAVS
ncbi:MAG: hypothetical protein PVI90_06435 [Desulfobacteraceae bacterium]|jgi:hypothetical protein